MERKIQTDFIWSFWKRQAEFWKLVFLQFPPWRNAKHFNFVFSSSVKHISFWFHLYSTPFPSPQLWSWGTRHTPGEFHFWLFQHPMIIDKTIFSVWKSCMMTDNVYRCMAHMLSLAKKMYLFCWWKFLWGREMGVMGGVRRRCDTVTAFIFFLKHPGSSDPVWTLFCFLFLFKRSD